METEVIKRPDRSVRKALRKAKIYFFSKDLEGEYFRHQYTNFDSNLCEGQIINLDFLNEQDKTKLLNAAFQAMKIVQENQLKTIPTVNIDSWDYINANLQKKGFKHEDKPIVIYINLGHKRKYAFKLQAEVKKEAVE